MIISIYTARSNEKRLEGNWGHFLPSFLSTLKRFFGCSWNLLCWNILKSIMERSTDVLATPNWLCSGHRTEILILILHLVAISEHKNRGIPLWANCSLKLYCLSTLRTKMYSQSSLLCFNNHRGFSFFYRKHWQITPACCSIIRAETLVDTLNLWSSHVINLKKQLFLKEFFFNLLFNRSTDMAKIIIMIYFWPAFRS